MTALLGVQNHGFVDARRHGFAPGVPGQRGIAAGVNFDFVFADVDVIAIVQGGALDAHVIYESAVETVEIFNNHAAGLEINLRVMVGYGKVVDRQIVVRGSANRNGPAAHGYLLHDLVFKH